jgi:HK97 family phage portal protein
MQVQNRAQYVRAGGANILQEGALADGSYGWVNDVVPVGGQMDHRGNVRWGDWPDAPKPSWYLGRDEFDGRPIGPNGPGSVESDILPSVTRCLTIIVNSVVRTNWRYSDAEGNNLPQPLWIADPMLIGRAPGPIGPLVPSGQRMDGQSFYATFLSHAILWGLGAFVCVESADGTPLPGTLRILNPYLLATDDTGHWVIDPQGDTPIRTNYDGRFIVGGRVWKLVVLRGLPPQDGRWPEGVLTRHFQTFRLGANVTKYVSDTMLRSGVPSGFLKVSTPAFKDADAKKLKDDWMAAHGGSRRSVAVLNATVDYSPLSMSMVDSNVEGLTHIYRGDVAHAFGLSSVWLDEGASGLTYSNVSDRRRDLVDVSLGNWAESLTQVLSSLMPYGQKVNLNWSTFVSPSLESQVQYLVQAVQTGLLTENEARQFMGVIPWTGRDPNFETWLAEKKQGEAPALPPTTGESE